MVNRVIDGRFELVERLGGGGMGLVWRAWDQALHREVALKEVRPPDPALGDHDPARAAELRARVLREARALARLNHPHVVTIHHIVDTGPDEFPWLVMELVTGGSLQDRLTEGPMSPAAAAKLGREVLSALRAAHAVGILHRDVKPANVLLRPDGRSVLTDFGIAAVQEYSGLTATGAFIGSPEFMAPERINGHEGDPASDLWSLGMLLYVAVEGRHPLRRATPLATLAAVLNQDPPPPERAGPLAPVLFALLRRDPAARPDPGTLDRMLADAEQAAFHQPPHSGPQAYPHAGPPPGPPPGVLTGPPQGVQAGPPLHPGPPGWNTVPPQYGPTGPTHMSRRGPRTPVIIAVSAVCVVAIVAWAVIWGLPSLLPDEPERPVAGGRTSEASTPRPSRTVVEDQETAEPEPSAPENLLTPAGMRHLVSQLKPVMGGTEVVDLVVYPTYAVAGAPVKGRKSVYDRFSYREGVASKEGPGGTVDKPTVNLSQYDWSVLPGLLRRAEKELGVKNPTSRYIIVDAAFWKQGSIRVYLSDEYNASGYLAADKNGKILAKYPAKG